MRNLFFRKEQFDPAYLQLAKNAIETLLRSASFDYLTCAEEAAKKMHREGQTANKYFLEEIQRSSPLADLVPLGEQLNRKRPTDPRLRELHSCLDPLVKSTITEVRATMVMSIFMKDTSPQGSDSYVRAKRESDYAGRIAIQEGQRIGLIMGKLEKNHPDIAAAIFPVELIK